MESGPDVSIIGTGALGSCLARAFSDKGIPVKSLFNRHPAKAEKLAEQAHTDIAGAFPVGEKQLGRLVFITVPDDYISRTAERLASVCENDRSFTAVHCSGNKPSDILRPLQKKGAGIASFHPLQTFTATSSPGDFDDIYFDIEGDDNAIEQLGEIADRLGARWFTITPAEKPYLHASAVMVSNYFIVLMETAGKIAASGGMDEVIVRKALLPLMEQSIKNAKTDDLSKILTGPVARGDNRTVREHLEILEPTPLLSLLYKRLGRGAVKLAERNGNLSREQLDELKKIFQNDE